MAAFDRGRAEFLAPWTPTQGHQGRVTEHRLTARRELLQALCEVDGVTHERVLGPLVAPDERGRDQSC